MGLIGKLVAYYREYGALALLRRIHRRRRFLVYVQDVDEAAPASDGSQGPFRVAGSEDVPMLASALGHWGPDPARQIRELMDSGDVAVVAPDPSQPDRAMCVAWLSRTDAFFRMLHGPEVPREEICSRKLWVPPAYRRRGLARQALAFIPGVAREQEARRIRAFVLTDNIASRRLHEVCGYRVDGVFRWGRRWGKRFAEYRRTGQSRWTALSPHDPADER